MQNNKKSDHLCTWLETPILICGREKSGTNLLVSLLDSHPELCVFSAGHLHPFKKNMEMTSNLYIGKEKINFLLNLETPLSNLDKGIIRGTKNLEIPKNSYRLNDFKKYCFQYLNEKNNWKDCIKSIFYAHQKMMNYDPRKLKGFVDSTPGNEHTSEIMFSFFPGGKMIHIVRNPLDNWSSWKKAGQGRKKRTIFDFILSWNNSTITYLKNRSKFGSKKYKIIIYENLVKNPKNETEKLANFLNIGYNQILTRPTKHGLSWEGNSMHTEKMEGISSSSINNYKKYLTNSEIKLIEKYCFPIYEKVAENIILEKKYITLLDELIGVFFSKNKNTSIKDHFYDYIKFQIHKYKKDFFIK